MENISFPFKIPFGHYVFEYNDELKDTAKKYFYSEEYRKKLDSIHKDNSIGSHKQDHKRNLYESPGTLFLVDFEHKDNVIWKIFKEFVISSTTLFSSLVNNNKYHQTKIVDSWFHITNSGGYHVPHDHRTYSWGCIYYLQTDECRPADKNNYSNGINHFYSPFEDKGRVIKGQEWNYKSGVWLSNPFEGHLIIFPGFIKHDASAYTGKNDRIIISANINIE